MSDIADISLHGIGERKIYLAMRHMKILSDLKRQYMRSMPFNNLVIGMCMHITKETAVLAETLKAGGASVSLCASNPLSTQDDVAAALAKTGIEVYGQKGESEKQYWKHIDAVARKSPNIILDDGADLTVRMHTKYRNKLNGIIGGCEETTTGVIRLHAMDEKNALKFPVIAVNDNKTKRLIDNYYGTGQSTLDGILRATNILIAGKNFVVCGYGPCGKGVSLRAKGMGANVIVCEVNPFRALKAHLDGYRVMPIKNAAKIGDIFVTVTGGINVISYAHMLKMKEGAILANSGHFDVEIDIKTLNKKAGKKTRVRPFLNEYVLKNGRRIYVCAEGRLVNLSAAEGHPSEVMATSFAGQCLAVEYLIKEKDSLNAGVHLLPEKIDTEIAVLQLKALGISMDKKTKEQKAYSHQWK